MNYDEDIKIYLEEIFHTLNKKKNITFVEWIRGYKSLWIELKVYVDM